jgi:hypothetical protein
LGAAFLLDNARYDKFAINSRFAKELDAFINLKNDSIYGVIDPAERKQMLSCSGVSVLAKLSKSRSTASDILDALHNGIYAEITSKSAMYFALSTSNRSLDITDITREFQGVYDSYFGISDATSVAMISGLQFPNKILNKFRIKFEETVKNMNGGNFIQDFAPLEPLKGLSFTREQVTPTSPRDLLMGLLNG